MSAPGHGIGYTLDAEQYAVVKDEIIASRPRVFAVCELERDDDGELVGGRVFTWGLMFADHAEMVGSTSGMHGSMRSMDRMLDALSCFGEYGMVWR
ncbi:MAG: hypothetical protein GEU83_04055 [Pseudonocardiaceae bacterium]|nr:hypothetical protein [Pseudonocardiaceae bacterium]